MPKNLVFIIEFDRMSGKSLTSHTKEIEKLIFPSLRKEGILSFLPNRKFYKSTRTIFYTSILTSLITTFNVFVDNFIAGHLGEHSIAAIGMATFSLGIINLITNGISMAFASVLAQSLNTKRLKDAQLSWDLILFINTALGLIALALFYIFGEKILGFQISHDSQAVIQGYEYMIWGIPAFFLNTYSFHYDKLFGVIGKTKVIFIVTVCIVLVNVGVSIGLTYGLNMGVTGTAIGTFVSVAIGFLIKMGMAHFDKDLMIKTLPYRLFMVKQVSWKFIEKTWYYLPFEGIWWALNFGATAMFTRNFENGEFVYSVGSPFWYTFISATGSIPILNKYVGASLGYGKEKLAHRYAKVITVMSIIRMVPFVAFLLLFGFLLPYIRIYDVPRADLWPGQVFLIYCSFTSALGIMYVIGYVALALGGRPKLAMLLDIISKSFVLICITIASVFTNNIMWGISVYVISSWITDIWMLYFSLQRKNFNSLYQKGQKSLLDKVEKSFKHDENLDSKLDPSVVIPDQ